MTTRLLLQTHLRHLYRVAPLFSGSAEYTYIITRSYSALYFGWCWKLKATCKQIANIIDYKLVKHDIRAHCYRYIIKNIKHTATRQQHLRYGSISNENKHTLPIAFKVDFSLKNWIKAIYVEFLSELKREACLMPVIQKCVHYYI